MHSSPIDTQDAVDRNPAYRHDFWSAKDWQPPAIMRTQEQREPPLSRSDLKAPLNLSDQDLQRAQQVPPSVSRSEQHVFNNVVIATKSGHGKRRIQIRVGSMRHRVLTVLRQAPPGIGYTVEEVAFRAKTKVGPVAAVLWSAKQWSDEIEVRMVVNAKHGKQAQYRLRQTAPWPDLVG